MQIIIADLSLNITGNKYYLPEDLDLAYHSFALSSNHLISGGGADISVQVLVNTIKPTVNFHKMYDNGESWQIYRDSGFFYLIMHSKYSPEPICRSKIDQKFTAVDLVFNKKIIPHFSYNSEWLSNPTQYPLDQILLMHHMAIHNKGLLVHCAGIDLDGKGYIFPGKSGAGKSTLTHQLAGQEHFELLSDDRMIVRKIEGTFRAFGTPWPGEAGVAVNKSVPLEALFFIHHSDENRVEALAPKIAVERLMPVSSIPWYDREAVINLLDFCDDLTASVPAYDLYFKPTTEIAIFLQSITLP